MEEKDGRKVKLYSGTFHDKVIIISKHCPRFTIEVKIFGGIVYDIYEPFWSNEEKTMIWSFAGFPVYKLVDKRLDINRENIWN